MGISKHQTHSLRPYQRSLVLSQWEMLRAIQNSGECIKYSKEGNTQKANSPRLVMCPLGPQVESTDANGVKNNGWYSSATKSVTISRGGIESGQKNKNKSATTRVGRENGQMQRTQSANALSTSAGGVMGSGLRNKNEIVVFLQVVREGRAEGSDASVSDTSPKCAAKVAGHASLTAGNFGEALEETDRIYADRSLFVLCQDKGVTLCVLRLLWCLLQVKRRSTCHHILGLSLGICNGSTSAHDEGGSLAGLRVMKMKSWEALLDTASPASFVHERCVPQLLACGSASSDGIETGLN